MKIPARFKALGKSQMVLYFAENLAWIMQSLGLRDTDDTNTLTITWDENDSVDRALKLKVNGGNRTLDLSENLTVGNGADVTLVAEDTATTITMDEQNFEVEGEGTAAQLTKLVNANNSAATLSIDGVLGTVGDNIIIKDAGYIGSASDTDAIQIEADGDVVFSKDIYSTQASATAALTLTGDDGSTNASYINLKDSGDANEFWHIVKRVQDHATEANDLVILRYTSGYDTWLRFDVSAGNLVLSKNLIIPNSGTIGPVADTDLMTLVDSQLTVDGIIVSNDGFRTTSPQYSPGMWVQDYGEGTAEHTNQTGSYDHTGGTSEKIFTKSAGDDFAQADATNGNWILMTGANRGAVAEIKEYLSTTTVVVDGLGWDGDLASQTFQIYKHPTFVTGAGKKTEFSTGTSGEFEVHSYGFTSSTMAHLKNNVAVDDSNALKITVNGNGYQDLDAIHADYNTGTLLAGDRSDVIHVKVDETKAVGADDTTHIHSIALEKTNVNSTIHTDGIHVGPGHTNALHVVGTPPIDPAFGYEVSSGGTTETDRVNGGAGDGNAFLVAGNDLQIFDAVDDYILIGSAAAFEIIEVNLATGGSKDSSLEFYYTSDGAGAYTRFYPSDSTNGFQSSGHITFSSAVLAGAGWQADDQSMDGSAITSAFYIAIKRTKLGAYTEPVEDYFKLYADQTGGMTIRGDGLVQLPYLTAIPANPVNGMVWMEADGLHLYYGGAEKVVAGA